LRRDGGYAAAAQRLRSLPGSGGKVLEFLELMRSHYERRLWQTYIMGNRVGGARHDSGNQPRRGERE